MKTMNPGTKRFPKLYQNFSSAGEIARTINRSRSYVFKALKVGFTDREWEMLNERIESNQDC